MANPDVNFKQLSEEIITVLQKHGIITRAVTLKFKNNFGGELDVVFSAHTGPLPEVPETFKIYIDAGCIEEVVATKIKDLQNDRP